MCEWHMIPDKIENVVIKRIRHDIVVYCDVVSIALFSSEVLLIVAGSITVCMCVNKDLIVC